MNVLKFEVGTEIDAETARAIITEYGVAGVLSSGIATGLEAYTGYDKHWPCAFDAISDTDVFIANKNNVGLVCLDLLPKDGSDYPLSISVAGLCPQLDGDVWVIYADINAQPKGR